MKSIIGLAAIALASNCVAQEVPNNSCTAPVVPNRQASDVVVKNFNKRVTAYTKCINDYIDVLKVLQQASNDPAKVKEIQDKGTAALGEYNALMEVVKKNSTNEDE
jgi:hypothetical protein